MLKLANTEINVPRLVLFQAALGIAVGLAMYQMATKSSGVSAAWLVGLSLILSTIYLKVVYTVPLIPAILQLLALCTAAELEEEIRLRKVVTSKLVESEARVQRIISDSSNGHWEWERKSGRVWFATRFKELLGYDRDEFPNQFGRWFRQISPEFHQQFRAILDNHTIDKEAFSIDLLVFNRAGEQRWMQVKGQMSNRPSGQSIISGSMLDVTERYELQSQLNRLKTLIQKEQKLAAVGSHIGCVTHEFNNMLQAVNGYVDFAIESSVEGTEVHTNLMIARKAGDKAEKITKQLLNYSREGKAELVSVNLNEAVRDTAEILKPMLAKNIFLAVECCEEPAMILGDTTKLSQAFMNLCLNAKDAMPKGGTIKVQSTIQERNTPSDKETDKFISNKSVVVSVRDTGNGIPAEAMKRIYDPFFTTKKVGKGTGMGLPVTQGIIDQHGGAISVDSSKENGTEFKIEIPCYRIDTNTVDGKEDRIAKKMPRARMSGEWLYRRRFIDT